MRHLSLALLLSIVCLSIQAQEITKSDTTLEEYKSDKKPHQDMLLVDLNWDRLLGLNDPVKQKWYGRGVGVSLMYDYPLNKNGNVSVAIGGGFASHNYYTNALITKIDSSNVSYFMDVPDSVRSRGKVSANFIDIPVELRFRTNEDKRGYRWKLAVGARLGYQLDVHEKIFDGTGRKYKTYYYPHTALFRYGPVVRVGYGSLMLTGFYSVSTFFEPGFGLNDLNGLTVGLTIAPF